MKVNHSKTSADKRKIRVRSKVMGTTARPRLSVFRSNRYIYLQVIDDQAGKTLVSINSKTAKVTGNKMEQAIQSAKALAEKLKVAKINKLVFDRGSYRYHGRVKAIAEVMREEGVQV
ncbi:50S ribosomal protein L18 [soil metagenome]